MNELALFAGAGGGILGGHLLGWRTVCAVEWEPYPASVLCARQNDGFLPPFPIWEDGQTFDGTPWRGIVAVVAGGFPCQDISAAGGGAGINGERSGMWREMARIICEVQPRFAFVENSPMLTSRGLGTVLGNLASMGFDAKWGVLGAADVGANHQRDRIWIVAINTNHARIERGQQQSQISISQGELANSSRKQRAEGRDDYGQDDGSKPATDGQHASKMADATELFSNGGNDNAKISMERKAQSEFGDGCRENFMADTSGTGRKANKHTGSTDRRTFCGSVSQQGENGAEQHLDNSLFTGLERAHNNAKPSQWIQQELGQRCVEVSNATSLGLSGQGQHEQPIHPTESRKGQATELVYGRSPDFWTVEPDVGRVADGVAARVDRLKAIGNGQVPLCAATAWNLLTK